MDVVLGKSRAIRRIDWLWERCVWRVRAVVRPMTPALD